MLHRDRDARAGITQAIGHESSEGIESVSLKAPCPEWPHENAADENVPAASEADR